MTVIAMPVSEAVTPDANWENACTAHRDRAQKFVPAYKMGLCRNCYTGKAIFAVEEKFVGPHIPLEFIPKAKRLEIPPIKAVQHVSTGTQRYLAGLNLAKAVCAEVAQVYGVEVEAICSHVKTAELVKPRHVSFYILHKYGGMHYPTIGKLFLLHHTSVMHGYRKISSQVGTDQELARIIKAIVERRGWK